MGLSVGERERGVCVRVCEKERAGERESYDFRERKIELERERVVTFSGRQWCFRRTHNSNSGLEP
jgi:hypothetical protein